jgi:hypothetical protein
MHLSFSQNETQGQMKRLADSGFRGRRWVQICTAGPQSVSQPRITQVECEDRKMRKTYNVHHDEHVTNRGFDEVLRAFEDAVGSVEDGGLRQIVSDVSYASGIRRETDGVRESGSVHVFAACKFQ